MQNLSGRPHQTHSETEADAETYSDPLVVPQPRSVALDQALSAWDEVQPAPLFLLHLLYAIDPSCSVIRTYSSSLSHTTLTPQKATPHTVPKRQPGMLPIPTENQTSNTSIH